MSSEHTRFAQLSNPSDVVAPGASVFPRQNAAFRQNAASMALSDDDDDDDEEEENSQENVPNAQASSFSTREEASTGHAAAAGVVASTSQPSNAEDTAGENIDPMRASIGNTPPYDPRYPPSPVYVDTRAYGLDPSDYDTRSPTYSPQSPRYSPTSPPYSPRSPPYSPRSPPYSPQSPASSPRNRHGVGRARASLQGGPTEADLDHDILHNDDDEGATSNNADASTTPTGSSISPNMEATTATACCIVCQENAAICIALPCLHLSYCAYCARQMWNRKQMSCAKCRVPLLGIKRVYH